MTNFERILTWIMADIIETYVEEEQGEIDDQKLKQYQEAIEKDPTGFKIFVDCLFETEPHYSGEGTQLVGYEYAHRVCKHFVEKYPQLAGMITVYVYS